MTASLSVSYDAARLEHALAGLADRPIGATEKGFLPIGPIAPSQLVGRSVDELLLPLAVIDSVSLDHNIALMADYCRSAGVQLAPHVKTTMSPQIFGRQLRAGAWGLSVANVTQARVCIDHGVRRVLIANEIVDPREIASLARDIDSTGAEVTCYVDSARGVHLLGDGLRRQRVDAQLSVLVEVGVAGQRAGVRTIEAAIDVATSVHKDPTLALVGVAGFEGILADDRSPDSLDRVDSLCRRILEIAAAVEPFIQPGRNEPMILSAGGSVFFDRVASLLVNGGPSSLPRTVILRSGAYVSHDYGYLGVLSPLATSADRFIAAIEVHGVVLSVPEPTKAIVAIGKRDVGIDFGSPKPIRAWHRTASPRVLDDVIVSSMNDQHAHLMLRDGRSIERILEVGDVVAFGIAHPCTTFDRWRFIPIVKDGGIVDISPRRSSSARGRMRISLTSADSPTPRAAYSQAIATDHFVFTAGFGPHDPVTGGVVGDGIQAQTRQTLTNIERILEADRLGLGDIVKVTVHLADLRRDFAAFDAVYRELIPAPYPVRTTVGSQLMDILVEVDVVAVRGR